jgi:hypothetical protein
MRQEDDIHTAIGDCFGAISSLALTDLSLKLRAVRSAWDDNEDDDDDNARKPLNTDDNMSDDVVGGGGGDGSGSAAAVAELTPMTGFYCGDRLSDVRESDVGALNRGARHAFVVTVVDYAKMVRRVKFYNAMFLFQ